MKYFWICPKDHKANNWILYTETEDGVRLLDPYERFVCPKCRKPDEELAVRTVSIRPPGLRSTVDLLCSCEGFMLVSNRFRDLGTTLNIAGIEYLPADLEGRYSILLPARVAEVDVERCGVEFHRPCPQCGRCRETCLWPLLESITGLGDPNAMVCPRIRLENTRGRVWWFLIPEPMRDAFRAAKLKGAEYVEAY